MGKRSRRRWREQGLGKCRPAKQPAQPATGAGPAGGRRPVLGSREIEEMVAAAAGAFRQREDDVLKVLVVTLVACWDQEAAASSATLGSVPSSVERRLEEAIGAAWLHGWQPGDLPRPVGRKLSSRHARLSVDVIAGESRRYAGSADADPEWLRQLEEVEARVWWDPGCDHLDAWAGREGIDRTAALRHAIELLSLLWHLPDLPRLCPPPSEWGRSARMGRRHAVRGHGADPRMLHRVRGLLSKAESTTFPDEAEALTTKAQQLMTRHAIDRAMVECGGGPDVTSANAFGRPRWQPPRMRRLTTGDVCCRYWRGAPKQWTTSGVGPFPVSLSTGWGPATLLGGRPAGWQPTRPAWESAGYGPISLKPGLHALTAAKAGWRPSMPLSPRANPPWSG